MHARRRMVPHFTAYVHAFSCVSTLRCAPARVAAASRASAVGAGTRALRCGGGAGVGGVGGGRGWRPRGCGAGGGDRGAVWARQGGHAGDRRVKVWGRGARPRGATLLTCV
eukprot:29633-Chlamydomonas_euryale.AAC.1